MKKLYKIWGEHISIIELLLALIISISFIFIALFLERKLFPNDNYQLLFGIIAVIIALFVNMFLFKPKRNIKWVDGDKDDN